MSRRKVETLVGLALRRGGCAHLIVFSTRYEVGLATVGRLWGEGIGLKRGKKL